VFFEEWGKEPVLLQVHITHVPASFKDKVKGKCLTGAFTGYEVEFLPNQVCRDNWPEPGQKTKISKENTIV